MNIFVYGTLKPNLPPHYQVSYVLRHLPHKEAQIHGDLYLVSGKGFSFPAITNLESDNIINGYLIKNVSERYVKELDKIEGSMYKKQEVQTLDGEKATTYVWIAEKKYLLEEQKIKHGNFELVSIKAEKDKKSINLTGIPLEEEDENNEFDCYIQEINDIYRLRK